MRSTLLSVARRLGALGTTGTPCLLEQPCAPAAAWRLLCLRQNYHAYTATRSVAGFSRDVNKASSFPWGRAVAAFDKSSSSRRPHATLSEIEFQRVADETLDLLQDQLDELLEDASVEDSDVKCDSGVLELTLGDKGTYVINKQAPNKQIWLSSPLSGPFRYDYSKEDESWIYSRDKHKLEEKLSKELSEILNTTIMIKTSELL